MLFPSQVGRSFLGVSLPKIELITIPLEANLGGFSDNVEQVWIQSHFRLCLKEEEF